MFHKVTQFERNKNAPTAEIVETHDNFFYPFDEHYVRSMAFIRHEMKDEFLIEEFI